MSPSADQIKSMLRSVIALFGGLIAGFAAGHGWMTQEQAIALLNNDQFLSTATTLILWLAGLGISATAGIWSVSAHQEKNMVATVAALPDVAKVEVMPTPRGLDLQAAVGDVPGALVTVASR